MCFSEKWSLGFSILGGLISLYRIYNKYLLVAILLPVFYTIMEITQYYQYKVIDQCDNLINQNLTKLTWVLQWIQPLLLNILYFYITKSNKGVFKFAIVLSLIVFITGVGLIHRLGYSFSEGWISAKLGVWLLLSASMPIIAKRLPEYTKAAYYGSFVLLLVAKPTSTHVMGIRMSGIQQQATRYCLLLEEVSKPLTAKNFHTVKKAF